MAFMIQAKDKDYPRKTGYRPDNNGPSMEMSDLEKWAMERRVKRARRKMVADEILRRFLSIYAVGFMLLALISALIQAITK